MTAMMTKQGLILAGLLLGGAMGCAAPAADPASSTEDVKSSKKGITIEGDEMHLAREIYEAMQAPEEHKDTEMLSVRVKNLPGLSCERVALQQQDPIQTVTPQHRCTVEGSLSQEQIAAIYDGLDVPELVTHGIMLDKTVKAVGSLLVIKPAFSEGELRLTRNTGCKSVRGAASARTCLQFWASEVFPSYEGPNVADTSEAAGAKDRLSTLLTENDELIRPESGWDKAVRDSRFVGGLLQKTDEGGLAFFVVDEGEYVVPRELAEVNLADIGEEGLTNADLDAWSLGIATLKSALADFTVD